MTGRLTSFGRHGLTFEVIDAGDPDAVPVILLHGFPATVRSWERVVPRLADAGHRVLVPAQRGYSPAARPVGRRAYRLEELVADVVALADAAEVPVVDVVGHDWGAVVAWGLAAAHPDRVRTLTAVSVPHPRAFRDAALHGQLLRSWYVLAFQLPVLPERLLRAGGGAAGRRVLERSGLPPDLAADYVDGLSHPGAAEAAVNWYRAALVDPASLGGVGRIRAPTMMVWSDGDRFVVRAGVEGTAGHVDGPYRLEVLPGVSHWIPETAPDRLADLVLDHLG